MRLALRRRGPRARVGQRVGAGRPLPGLAALPVFDTAENPKLATRAASGKAMAGVRAVRADDGRRLG